MRDSTPPRLVAGYIFENLLVETEMVQISLPQNTSGYEVADAHILLW
jgi:hypothetical protein